jgi:hypothetical protein
MATKTLVPLAAFRSEFEYLLQDHEVESRSAVELAFEHLRRLIVVDDQVRKKWQAGFEQHETHCERLGSVHLLSHGIWAFKVATGGAATDLVFPEPIETRASHQAYGPCARSHRMEACEGSKGAGHQGD